MNSYADYYRGGGNQSQPQQSFLSQQPYDRAGAIYGNDQQSSTPMSPAVNPAPSYQSLSGPSGQAGQGYRYPPTQTHQGLPSLPVAQEHQAGYRQWMLGQQWKGGGGFQGNQDRYREYLAYLAQKKMQYQPANQSMQGGGFQGQPQNVAYAAPGQTSY